MKRFSMSHGILNEKMNTLRRIANQAFRWVSAYVVVALAVRLLDVIYRGQPGGTANAIVKC
ncbi:MAG: hypothetical protein FJ387_24220 [Verrucomicrobia bacterium]|nr:hypothetical protein [Verrucomicrobiota bacterium]